MNNLLAKGSFISEDDLPSLRPGDESENLGKRLEKYLGKYGVWRSLFLAYGGPYMKAIAIRLIRVRLVTYLNSGP